MWSCVENSFNVLSSENRIIREINFEEGSRRSNFFFTVEWKEAHLMGAFQWDMECKTWGCGTLEEGPTLFAQQKVTLCSTPPPTPQHSLSSSHGADEWTNEWHEGKEQRLRNVNRLAHPPEKKLLRRMAPSGKKRWKYEDTAVDSTFLSPTVPTAVNLLIFYSVLLSSMESGLY